MEGMGRNGVAAAVLPPPAHQQNPAPVIALRRGIWNILSRWNALQMAVENKWGGTDSLDKSHQLASDIESWFSKSKGRIFDMHSFIFLKLRGLRYLCGFII